MTRRSFSRAPHPRKAPKPSFDSAPIFRSRRATTTFWWSHAKARSLPDVAPWSFGAGPLPWRRSSPLLDRIHLAKHLGKDRCPQYARTVGDAVKNAHLLKLERSVRQIDGPGCHLTPRFEPLRDSAGSAGLIREVNGMLGNQSCQQMGLRQVATIWVDQKPTAQSRLDFGHPPKAPWPEAGAKDALLQASIPYEGRHLVREASIIELVVLQLDVDQKIRR